VCVCFFVYYREYLIIFTRYSNLLYSYSVRHTYSIYMEESHYIFPIATDHNIVYQQFLRLFFSYNKNQRDAQLSQIYSIKYSTCFRQVHSPSSGVSQHSIHALVICHASSVGCMLIKSQQKVGYFVLESGLRARNICFGHVPCLDLDFLIM